MNITKTTKNKQRRITLDNNILIKKKSKYSQINLKTFKLERF